MKALGYIVGATLCALGGGCTLAVLTDAVVNRHVGVIHLLGVLVGAEMIWKGVQTLRVAGKQ